MNHFFLQRKKQVCYVGYVLTKVPEEEVKLLPCPRHPLVETLIGTLIGHC